MASPHVTSAQQPSTPTPPDHREIWVPADQLQTVLAKHPTAIVLSRAQYASMLRDATRAPSKTPEPPRRATLASAKYSARARGRVLEVSGELLIHVATDGWAQVPLPFGNATLGALRIDGEAAVISPTARGKSQQSPAALLLRGRGERRLHLEFTVPIGSNAGLSRVALQLPPAAANTFEVELPPNVHLENSQPAQLHRTPEATRVTVAPPALAGGFDLSWRASGAAAEGATVVSAHFSGIHRIDAEKVHFSALIEWQSALGNLPLSLRLKVPAGAQVQRVQGEEVARWSLGAGQAVTIELQPGDRTQARVQLEMEQPALAGAEQATVTLPLFEIEGVNRVEGSIAIDRDESVLIKEIVTDAITVRENVDARGEPQRVARYRFERSPTPPRVSLERLKARLNADLDTRVEFLAEAIFIERTLTFRDQAGEAFSASITLPAGEELLTVRRADDSEPEWRIDARQVHLRWTDRSREPRVFKLRSRIDPPAWAQLPAEGLNFALGDATLANAEKVTGYIALSADESFRLEAAPSDSLEPRDARTTPVKGQHAWFRRDTFDLRVKVTKRPGAVIATLTGYALPMAGVLDLHARIDYHFLHSGARSVRIRVPEPIASNFHFDGEQIAERNLAGDIWTIVFQKELTGAYGLKVTAQVPIPKHRDETRFEIDLPVIAPLDVQRTSGVWAVEANTETEILFTSRGMNELDSLLAPALPDHQPRHRVIGVFGYLGAGYALKLAGVRHQTAAMLATVVDQLDLDTVVSTSGAERHQATFHLRTAAAQFLDVTLPPGSHLWSLAVDDNAVKPVADQPGKVRVPLPARRGAATSIALSAIYETPKKEWGSSGTWEVTAPSLAKEIPVLRTRWQLFLPEGFEYRALESNLRVPPRRKERPLVLTPLRWYDDWRIARAAFALGSAGNLDPRPLEDLLPRRLQEEAGLLGRAETHAPEIERLLREAEGFASAGRYGRAAIDYDHVLALDPYNVTARKALEEIKLAEENLALGGYNETRSRALWKTTPQFDGEDGLGVVRDAGIRGKLERIVVPRVDFRGVSLREAIEFLRAKAAELEPELSELIILSRPDPAAAEPARITLTLTNIPFSELLKYVASLAGMKVQIESSTVVFVPLGTSDSLQVKGFALTEEGFKRLATGTSGNVKEMLERQGVAFPPGASAVYLALGGRLLVRNTDENLQAVEALVQAHQSAPAAEPPGAAANAAGITRIRAKLDRIIIPRLELRDATVREALEFLRRPSIELDTQEPDPARRGINFVLKIDAPSPSNPAFPAQAIADSREARITVSLTNIPLGEALRYITSLSNLSYRVEPYAVSIVPLVYSAVLVTKEYRVPPGFFRDVPISPRMDARDLLIQSGVAFPPGAEAFYFPATSRMVVRNTQENLDLVETTISLGSGAKPDPAMAAQPGPPAVAGLLPMKLELPRVGQPTVFDGFYNAERVEFRYEDWWARARRLWFWCIGGGLLFLRFGRARPWWRTAWAVLVLSFAPLCLSESFTAICNALLGGWLVTLVLHRVSARLVFAPQREEGLA